MNAGATSISGTLNVTEAGVFNGLDTLSVSSGANLTCSGAMTAQAPIINGTLNVASPGVFNAANGLNISSGTLSGSGHIDVTGLTTVSGTVTLAGSGILNALGGLHLDLYNSNFALNLRDTRTVNLYGNSTWNEGDVYTYNSPVINNHGTFTATLDRRMYCVDNGSPVFNNLGTFSKTGGAGISDVYNVPFNNSGTVNVQSGTLSLLGGGTHSGQFNVDGGKTLSLSGNHTFNPGASMSGAGALEQQTGTTQYGISTCTDQLRVAGGTFIVAGNTSLAGGFTVSGNGTQTGTGTLNVAGLTSVTVTGGTLAGSGILNALGGLHLDLYNSNFALNLRDTRTVNLYGNSTWNEGDVYTYNSPVINNHGTFTATLDRRMYCVDNGSPVFNNLGTFSKTGGAGISDVYNVPFNNSGTVNAQSGTISFSGTFTQTAGETRLAGGAISGSPVLQFNGGLLTGAGMIAARVANAAAIVKPGAARPGLLAVNSSTSPAYSQAVGGTLEIDLGGTTPGVGYDQLAVTGNVTFGGTLRIRRLTGFAPAVGQQVTIMTYTGTRTGTFATIVAEPAGLGVNATYPANAVVITVTSVPGPSGADLDGDGDIDAGLPGPDDFDILSACATGPVIQYDPAALPVGCSLTPDAQGRIAADFDADGDVDGADFGAFQRCLSGENKLADPNCGL